MRVANISLYQNSTYNLSNLTSGLQNLNDVMATQKKINTVSDDPVGMSQVLDLNTTLGNLDQIEKNVDMGFAWIKESENALDSANSLILEVKTQIARLANDSMTADERSDAVATINAAIDQIVSMGNTQVNGNYIFGGTNTDDPPLEYDEATGSVIYNGDQQNFCIKTDTTSVVPVGMAGSDMFWDDIVDINATNNTIVFKEDIGHDSTSEKILSVTLEQGEYTTAQLEQTIEKKLNQASADNGYNVTYEVRYDAEEKRFSIRENGTFDGYIETEFMWETGKDAYLTGFNSSDIFGPDGIDIELINPDALTIATPLPRGTEPVRLSWQGDNTWELENNPGYSLLPSSVTGKDNHIEIDINGDSSADISIDLDQPAQIKGQFIEFDIVPAQGDKSVGHEIGFNEDNTTYAPRTSDETAVHITELTITLGSNDGIEFIEYDANDTPTSCSATIADGTYTDMDDLSDAIALSMKNASGNGIEYAVSYDETESRFLIREDGSNLNQLDIQWNATTDTADTLGFYHTTDTITYPKSDHATEMSITIDETNNQIAFKEVNGLQTSSVLWATIENGTYATANELELAIEDAMQSASQYGSNYEVIYNTSAPNTGKISIEQSGGTALTGISLLWNTAQEEGNSIGDTLGFNQVNDTGGGISSAYVAEDQMVLMSFDDTNNKVDFRETAIDDTLSDVLTVTIPEGDYTDLDDVASALQKSLRAESPNGVQYSVSYDDAADQFMIKGSDASIQQVSFYWQTGINRDSNAAEMLGFYGDDEISFSESDESVVNITIDAETDKIDFREVMPSNDGKSAGILTAEITQKTYTNHEDLAMEIELAMEKESQATGNHIDYAVTWDKVTQHFTIKENGTEMEGLELLWETGPNAPTSVGGDGGSIGGVLGFEPEDEIHRAMESQRDVEWGIFNTLIDIREDLADNDQDGLERAIGRLEANYKNMTSRIVDVGVRYNRLEIRDKIVDEIQLDFTERRSEIEDVDILESVMKMQNVQIAYQAALSTTSRVMQLSLVDYI